MPERQVMISRMIEIFKEGLLKEKKDPKAMRWLVMSEEERLAALLESGLKEEYRKKIPDDEKYESELKEKEQRLLLDSIGSKADYIKWSKKSHWDIKEAVSLLFELDPDSMNWDAVKNHQEKLPLAKEISERLEAVERMRGGGELERDLNTPKKYRDLIETKTLRYSGELIRLVDEVEDTINTKVKQTLLRMIYSMARDKYGHNRAGNSKATSEIQKATDKYTKEVHVDTIRSYLDKAVELLESEIIEKEYAKDSD